MMKKLNNIDHLLRSSLAFYKPVPDQKSEERFLASAFGLWAGSNSSGLNWKYLLLAAIFLLGISGMTYYYLSPVDGQKANRVLTQTVNPKTSKLKTDIPESAKPEKASKVSEKNIAKSENTTVQPVNDTHTNPASTTEERRETSIVHTPGQNTLASYTQQDITGKKVSSSISNRSDTFTLIKIYPISWKQIPGLYDTQFKLMMREITKLPTLLAKPANNDLKKIKKSKTLNMAYSLHYRPEIVFNIIDNNKLVHTFGAEVHFKLFNDKYVIRTGFSTSISQGYYEYDVLYNEYLGSYEGLDSVTFQWDENHYHLIPTYYTSEREVFDTAIQTDVSKVYKRFSYLQIPLMLGYDFITHESFSMGVRFGPTLSILLSDHTLSNDYDPGKHRVIQVNQITPDRIKTNWMLSAGINLSFYSKKNLFYQIEPQFSYYFNSVYQKYDVSKPPFSIGIRLSIGIK